MFENRKLLIVSMHKKEQVIAPILEKELGVTCFISDFNTDSLGTFSGEIKRKKSVFETLQEKCNQALKNTDFDLVLASEGSFGNHPSIFFAQADDEVILFKDLKNNLEIFAREISMETNFSGENIKNIKELHDFSEKVLFPSHALILKSFENNPEIIFKAIQNKDDLIEKFEQLSKVYFPIYVETDMRAHLNPTRMRIIKKTTEKLVAKIKSKCPNCQMPGFDIVEFKKGLKCEICKNPTNSIISHLYQCKKCKHLEEKKYPNQKLLEDPTFCDYCNP